MRCILFFLLLLIISCSDQHVSTKETTIDTTKLFNPNNHPDGSAMDMNMFKRSLAISGNEYEVILNGKQTPLQDLSAIRSFIISNKEEIKKDLFFILLVKAPDFKTTLSIINLFTDNQVTDYKVINAQEYFDPPAPVAIETPSSIVTTLLPTDSSYFFIEPFQKSILVRLYSQESTLENPEELDRFIESHKNDIRKIVLVNSKNLSKEKLASIIEILKRNKIYTYHLVTKNE